MWLDTESDALKAIRTFAQVQLEPLSESDDMLLTESDLSIGWNQPATSDMLGHYFRSVFRLIGNAETALGQNHFRFIKTFRAQLSNHELRALALNCWLDPQGKKVVPLIEKYGLLKHLPPSRFRRSLEASVNPSCFGRGYASGLQAMTKD